MPDYLALLASRIGRIRAGEAAKGLLPRLSGAPRSVLVAVPPTWAWLPPKADVGRKGAWGSMPVRLSFEAPDGALASPCDDAGVIVAPKGGLELEWSAAGAGWSLRGVATLSQARGRCHEALPLRLPDELPRSVPAARMSRPEARRFLGELAADGEVARWEVREELARMAHKYVCQARAKVSRAAERGEISLPRGPGGWLDDIGVDIIRDTLVYGSGDGPSRGDRLIELCLAPRAFERVDPLRYVSVSLRSAAGHAVRRHIGDPSAGAEVRRLADRLGLPHHRRPSHEELLSLLAAYRQAHPKDRLGRSRALAALALRSSGRPHHGREELHVPDPAEDAVAPIAVSTASAALVRLCREEGGEDLALVAERWLEAASAGEPFDVPRLARELFVEEAWVRSALSRVQGLAVCAFGVLAA